MGFFTQVVEGLVDTEHCEYFMNREVEDSFLNILSNVDGGVGCEAEVSFYLKFAGIEVIIVMHLGEGLCLFDFLVFSLSVFTLLGSSRGFLLSKL